ncbi:MAG: hypothetical protein ACXWAV_06885 [Chthoniobacterales bacterium]
MTDYFALLDQPEQPWLDPEKLKEVFHAKARDAHPDAEVNEAYQVLRDPKRRLHHLLALRDALPPNKAATIPSEIEALFSEVAVVTRAAEIVGQKLQHATNKLARSLLQKEVGDAQRKLEETLTKVTEMRDKALVRLKTVEANDSAGLHALYLQFSYLNRWLEQLEEKQLQLRL